MTADEMRELLQRRVDTAGGHRAFSRLHKIKSPGYVGRVLKGEKPGPAILDAIGLEEVETEPTYRRKRK